MNTHLKIFFKGFAMGIAEIIPGISGGTVRSEERRVGKECQP